MRRVGLVLASLIGLSAAPGHAAIDDVSVTIGAGPGVVMAEPADLYVGSDGRLVLDPLGMVVADTSGSGAGWRVVATAGGQSTILAADDRPATPLRLPAGSPVVVLTAATAAL